MAAMQRLLWAVAFLVLAAVALGEEKLQIGVLKRPPTCDRKAKDGDKVFVHYEGKLTDGTQFDSSYDRQSPFSFVLGGGQVIKGWDQGVVGMCVGEIRRLVIPSSLGYGDAGSPPTIPAKATLKFKVEFMSFDEAADEEEDMYGDDDYSYSDDAELGTDEEGGEDLDLEGDYSDGEDYAEDDL